MTVVFLMACLYVWVSVFPKVHPLQLSGYLLLVGVFNSCYLSLGVSSLMGFCLFMMMVSGVLVLVAFCVALVPFVKNIKRSGGVKSGPKVGILPDYFGSGVGMFGIFFLVIVLVLFTDPLVSGGYMSWCSLIRTVEGFMCYYEWVVLIVFLSIYLMMTVVVSLGICSKYSGALVSKKWKKDEEKK
nr:NADH dehydrogenase subunit 6 [Kuphus polythalamius]